MKTLIPLILLTVLSLNVMAQDSLRRPQDGDYAMRILSSEVIELEIVTRKEKGQPLPYWDVVNENGVANLPEPGEFKILVDGEQTSASVTRTSFKRRTLYAPLGEHDLRIGSYIYLFLSTPLSVQDGNSVEVILPETLKSPPNAEFETEFSVTRTSNAIHINQAGYQIGYPKQAVVGYYLGDAGELPLEDAKIFYLRDTKTGKKVFSGAVKRIRDIGFPFPVPQYQRVLTVDFTGFDQPGNYVIGLSALGESKPFTISDGLFANIARTYALGLYHQRSGPALKLPYTRFTRGPSHTKPVRIPTVDDKSSNDLVDGMAEEPHKDQQAPELKGYATSLYPIIKTGEIDATGGHHDAGDYSKYTTNCAQLINHLMFATDSLPGVAGLDNLGIPESGDGVSDLLQIALYEANFLSELQDDDGGFFFLVYPDGQKYEDDVTPDEAGKQIVFPKNTASTAAATAALAQIGGSPHMQKLDMAQASKFLQQAERGWEFLEAAWEKYTPEGSYQRISHYGDVFMDRDEIIWAATELFLATKNRKYHEFVLNNYKPADSSTRKWGWQRLFEGYGAAARSYAYAKMSGRAGVSDLDPAHFRACQQEVWGWGKELDRYAEKSAYGLSFPGESKAFRAAGWYFPISDTLDLVAAAAQSDTGEFDSSILSNMNYELGANPTNTSFLTGIGYKRPFEIVHQWARNDDFQLPMTGIPYGALVDGVRWINTYERELGASTYPSDGDERSPYAFYDRFTDTFNVGTEFVTYQQGRALAASAYMMARTPLAKQPYTHLNGSITGAPERVSLGETVQLKFELADSGLKLEDAMIVWEARGMIDPKIGDSLTFIPTESGPSWATVEAQWPDGRRAFARAEFPVTTGNASDPVTPGDTTVFYFSGDSPNLPVGLKLHSGSAVANHSGAISVDVSGAPIIDNKNLLWMKRPAGGAIRFDELEDRIAFSWEQSAESAGLEISAWFYFEKFPHAVMTADLFAIGRDGENPAISLQFDKWAKPESPQLIVGNQGAIPPAELGETVRTGRWQKITMRLTDTDWKLTVNGNPAGSGAVQDPDRISSFFEGKPRTIVIGNFIGTVDDIHVKTISKVMPTLTAEQPKRSQVAPPTKQPRLLVLAFDCHPTLPSLPVIAFKMCRELGKIADVTVVSRTQDDHFEIDGTDTEFINIDMIKKPLDGIADILRGGRSVGWTTKTAFTYPSYIAFERAVWKRYKKALKAGEFDAVIRISPMSPILVSPMANWCPVPFIIGPVNGGLPFPKEVLSVQKKEREWLNPLRNFAKHLPYAQSSYKNAAAILAGFQHTFDNLPEKSLKNAINYPEIGYDPDLFFPADKMPPTDKIKFVFVGRLVAGKAADSLVEAFAINEKLQKHELTIVGDGPDRKIMEKMIAEHGLEDCVKLVGTKTQGEVGEILRESHVFAFPSIRELGAGVVIEAMGSGLPCVVFNSGAQGCLVGEDRGVPVKLVPRKDMPPLLSAAMQRYIDEPGLLQDHREKSLDYAEGYTWRHKAKNILETVRWTTGEIKEKPEFYPL